MNQQILSGFTLVQSLLGLGILLIASLVWHGLAQAQALRCTDAQGRVSYVGAGAQTGGVCTPWTPHASFRDRHGESREAATGRTTDTLPATDQRRVCMSSITDSLFAPNTARFDLRPSGRSVLVGHIDAQNRQGAYLRLEVWCEFGGTGTLQRAYIDYDPAVLRENRPTR